MFTADTEIQGLYLVLVEPRYSDDLFTLVEENRAYLRSWLPWLDQSITADDSKNFLRSCLQGFTAKTQLNTMMYLKDELIGIAGYHEFNHANHYGEIGYWLAEKHNGKGFMTATVKKLIEIGFEQYDLNRIVIRAASGNKKSQAVAKRLNFTNEGTARQAAHNYGVYHDLKIYSLLKSEWQK